MEFIEQPLALNKNQFEKNEIKWLKVYVELI